MDNDELIRFLRDLPKFDEAQVLIHRASAWWGAREVEIEVWDGGAAAGPVRYTATADVGEAEDGSKGRKITGNASATVQDALEAVAVHLFHYRPK